MDDVFVRVIDMPADVNGFVLPGADGYNVYLSSRLDRQGRIKTYEHELRHIRRGDYEKLNPDVQEIESDAHM